MCIRDSHQAGQEEAHHQPLLDEQAVLVALVGLGKTDEHHQQAQEDRRMVGAQHHRHQEHLSLIHISSRAGPARPAQYARAASSRPWVPQMLLWMKSPAPAMERSTCDSAAKCRIARG